MNIIIRQEQVKDYKRVFQVIEAAFKTEQYSDHKEQFLVEKLRQSKAFIPELSLVAIHQGQIIGHILLTKITIKNDTQSFESLALAPVSVQPNFQKKGIGGQLIKAAHQKAKTLGYQSIVLLGHETYYPRFGYQLTSQYGIQLPFNAPEANCMVIELRPNGLKGVSGVVEYDKAFYE